MNCLLDTHVLIWWLDDSAELSSSVRNIISNPENNIVVSHVSYWKIAIKVSIGRLVFPLNTLDAELQNNGFELLTINTAHIIQSTSLPMHHRDPFDRMLVTQAKINKLSLITKNHQIQKYDLSWFW